MLRHSNTFAPQRCYCPRLSLILLLRYSLGWRSGVQEFKLLCPRLLWVEVAEVEVGAFMQEIYQRLQGLWPAAGS